MGWLPKYKKMRKGAFTYYKVFIPRGFWTEELTVIKNGGEYSLFGGGSKAIKTVKAKNIREALKKLFKKK